jgi:hypothetical protein
MVNTGGAPNPWRFRCRQPQIPLNHFPAELEPSHRAALSKLFRMLMMLAMNNTIFVRQTAELQSLRLRNGGRPS